VGDAVTLGVRPEHLHWQGQQAASAASLQGGAAAQADTSAAGISARASVVESLGDVAYLYAEADDAADGLIVRVAPLSTIARNTALTLYAKPEHVHVFAADGTALPRRTHPAGATSLSSGVVASDPNQHFQGHPQNAVIAGRQGASGIAGTAASPVDAIAGIPEARASREEARSF
jgi:hypothetical protein